MFGYPDSMTINYQRPVRTVNRHNGTDRQEQRKIKRRENNMKLTHGTQEDLQKALEIVNKQYAGNIMFNRLEGNTFTLKVKDSKAPGHRLGFAHPNWADKKGNPYKQRRLASACWHVHGYFFDALFTINPKAVIRSQGNKITKYEGNWQDKNIGSEMYPMYFSEACECE
jgi:hypothetical protein